jgi:PTH1 family peptidyl-tRNA hydrolase
MKLFVGLGNPGVEYIKTRHNIGAVLVEKIAQNLHFQKKFNSLICVNNGMILAMPQTYMNRSGEAIEQICRFYKLNLANIYVAHDDIDLQLGKIKIKIGGGSGGHNGLKSIDQHIGANYIRIRLGVGRPQYGNVADYVLQNFRQDELSLVEKMLDFISNNIEELMKVDDKSDTISRILSKYS